jgi:heterodisulfide reductase subunit A
MEDKKTHNLWLVGENTLQKELYKVNVDMAILSVGLESRKDSEIIQRLLTLSRNQDGFFLEAHPKLRPVDAATGGVFFAGCAESPKDIKDSVTQASAAAARAGILMAKGKINVEAITPITYGDKCKLCGLCTKVCPYNALTLNKELKRIEIAEAACGGCGTCAAECPFGALTQKHFTDEQITAQIDAVTENDAGKKIVAFCCNWCSYAGADFAGVSRMQYPPNVRIIRTMCSGRVSPRFVERAFARGAAAVLVAGCHIGDCHYINANYQTQKRVERLWKKMEQNGLNKERLQLLWASAAEGERFASKIREMKTIVENVSPKEIETAQKVFEKALEVANNA